MAPPLIFLLVILAIAAIGLAVAFFAIRTGLWVRETSTRGDDTEGEPRFEKDERPDHTRVEDPGHQRYVGS